MIRPVLDSVGSWLAQTQNLMLLVTAAWLLTVIWSNRRRRRLQQRIVELEEAREQDRLRSGRKAELVASIVRELTSQGRLRDLLVIRNLGNAEAREVSVRLDDKPVTEHPAVASPAILRRQEEIRQVGPRSSFQYLLALSGKVQPPFEVWISWVDDSGEPGEYHMMLTL